MRHDYDLPPDWAAMTDEEKSRWMTQQRCKRQAERQGSPAIKHHEETQTRFDRRVSAHPATEAVER